MNLSHETSYQTQGINLHLAHPDTLSMQWVGEDDVLQQLLACWTLINPQDLPLHPRLIGKPGVGKTTLAYAAAKKLGKDVYIYQCTTDTRPEDLLISPVLDQEGKVRYAASSLVTAMIRGGVCILDEANRMSEKSWASLAPLLDSRRYIESILAGIKIPAHQEFRLAATMNQDASTYDLPQYIESRLKPQIYLEFPKREDEEKILQQNLPYVGPEIQNYVLDFLQKAHAHDEEYTVRDGIHIARYAAKRAYLLSQRHKDQPIQALIRQAITMTLGDEALAYVY